MTTTATHPAAGDRRPKVLVTGGGGAIGRRLLPYLMQSADVVCLDLQSVAGVTQSITWGA